MKTVDKISKEVLMLAEYSKDNTKNSIVSSNSTGLIDPPLTLDQLKSITSIIDASITTGYNRGITVFQKNIEKHLVQDTKKKK